MFLAFFIPGITALVITTALHNTEVEIFSCSPTLEKRKIDPFPKVDPLF
jgi:hypothetical protein